jgi:suppressor of ftsI
MRNDRRWPAVLILALIIGACGGGGGGSGLGPDLEEPPEIVSRDGVLRTTLTAQITDTVIGGRRVETRLYDGLFAPPTLRVRPGDTIELTLDNQIGQPTNLHTHGMNVSPLVPSDNVFVHIPDTQMFDYRITLPAEHPSGMFYYHPHLHGLSEFQNGSGMSGGIIVDGLLDALPPDLRDIEQHVLLLKDIQIRNGMVPDPPDSSKPTQRTVNGQVNPTIRLRPGETQLWRIGNVGADIYYHLELAGHTFYEIARDGNRLNQVIPRQEIMLPISSRVEVLVQASERPGRYPLRTLAIDMGPQGDHYPEVRLATMVIEGDSETPVALPTTLPPVEDLRDKPIARRRTFNFSEVDNPDGSQTFFINDKVFDANVVDTTVHLGEIEEWTLQNCSGENHVFHIHQLDFQVTEINGVAAPFVGHQDTVNLDYRDTDGPEDCPTDENPTGRVKVLMPFTNPVIVGKFVYHCHILEHEDGGMMQVIEVLP